MDTELVLDNQRNDKMPFKDLTARAAAAIKPQATDTAKNPAKAKETEADAKDTAQTPKKP